MPTRSTTITYIASKIKQLSSMKDLEQSQAIITKSGLFSHTIFISKLIDFASLSPLGNLAHAQSIFEETAMDDFSICNTMIRAYSKTLFSIRALHVYNHMLCNDIGSDHFTYTFVLKACARCLRCGLSAVFVHCKGREIHCRVLKLGYDCDQFIRNSLVHCYSSCGFLSHARQVFDEMPDKTMASWNIMILAYDQVKDFESADFLRESMPVKNVVSWNALIKRHVKLGDIKAAHKLFHEMPEVDDVSWNSLISGYVQVKEYALALQLYREMQDANVEPTDVTLTSVLTACAETESLHLGSEIHEFLKQRGHSIEGYLGSALVDMYAKCGNLTSAREVFNRMSMRSVGCWNCMIVGLAINGCSAEALTLFAKMEKVDDITPNGVTFIGVLIACSRDGLVEEGRKYFQQMTNVYNIVPEIKHYGCMVDLLSRRGLLHEAYGIVKSMPFDANSVLWRTLMAACKLHGDVELAEECFRELTKLKSLSDGDCVLLSNVYAQGERWVGAEDVRSLMMHMNISKKPGSSNVEIK